MRSLYAQCCASLKQIGLVDIAEHNVDDCGGRDDGGKLQLCTDVAKDVLDVPAKLDPEAIDESCPNRRMRALSC